MFFCSFNSAWQDDESLYNSPPFGTWKDEMTHLTATWNPRKTTQFRLEKMKGGEREDATDFARRNCSIMRFWRDRQNLWCDYPWVGGGGNAGNGFRKCRRRRRPNISEYLCARYNIGRGSLEIVADWKGGVLFDFFFFLLIFLLASFPSFYIQGESRSDWGVSSKEKRSFLPFSAFLPPPFLCLNWLARDGRVSEKETEGPPPSLPTFLIFFFFSWPSFNYECHECAQRR